MGLGKLKDKLLSGYPGGYRHIRRGTQPVDGPPPFELPADPSLHGAPQRAAHPEEPPRRAPPHSAGLPGNSGQREERPLPPRRRQVPRREVLRVRERRGSVPDVLPRRGRAMAAAPLAVAVDLDIRPKGRKRGQMPGRLQPRQADSPDVNEGNGTRLPGMSRTGGNNEFFRSTRRWIPT